MRIQADRPMSEYVACEILEMQGEPVEGVCLGGGYYPDFAKPVPENPKK